MAGACANVRPRVVPVCTSVKPVNVWLFSLAGPVLRLAAKFGTVCAGALTSTGGGLPAIRNVGASLIGFTVIVNGCGMLVFVLGGGLLAPLSDSVTEKVAVPLEFGVAV